MSQNVFDDLTDWAPVLSELAALSSRGELDAHQAELARLLRYRDNWRLREAALRAALEIRQASDLLIADALNVLVDPELALSTRIAACHALAHLLPRRQPTGVAELDLETVRKTMRDLAARSLNPVLQHELHQAVAATANTPAAAH